MPDNSLRIRTSATVANVTCGFDSLGYAISGLYDTILIKSKNSSGINITIDGLNAKGIPSNPKQNTAGMAVISLLNKLGINQGFDLHIEKGIPKGGGLGSSAASAAAAIFGVNNFLGNPLDLNDLLIHGIEGEKVVSGDGHADNIAPALFGGITLIKGRKKLDVIELPIPSNLYSTVVLPDVVINTMEARKILPNQIPLNDAIYQARNLATFIHALHISDFDLLGSCMEDLFAEPIRSNLIPYYNEIYKISMNEGAIGFGISGSGPATFALCSSEEIALRVGSSMSKFLINNGIECLTFTSPINKNSTLILD